MDQYQRFLKENPKNFQVGFQKTSPDPSGPRNDAAWYDAAAYCNWLSRREGLQECYAPNSEGEYAEGMKCIEGFSGPRRLPAAHGGGMGVHLPCRGRDKPLPRQLRGPARAVCVVRSEIPGSGLALRSAPAQRPGALRHAGEPV